MSTIDHVRICVGQCGAHESPKSGHALCMPTTMKHLRRYTIVHLQKCSAEYAVCVRTRCCTMHAHFRGVHTHCVYHACVCRRRRPRRAVRSMIHRGHSHADRPTALIVVHCNATAARRQIFDCCMSATENDNYKMMNKQNTHIKQPIFG